MGPGDIVTIALDNHPQYYTPVMAAWLCGAGQEMNQMSVSHTIIGQSRLIFIWHEDRHYTWPGSCIKMALPQAIVFSLGPVY